MIFNKTNPTNYFHIRYHILSRAKLLTSIKECLWKKNFKLFDCYYMNFFIISLYKFHLPESQTNCWSLIQINTFMLCCYWWIFEFSIASLIKFQLCSLKRSVSTMSEDLLIMGINKDLFHCYLWTSNFFFKQVRRCIW